MNKRVVRRLLETFFRRWWLYLVPLTLFSLMGVAKAMQAESGYRSVGVVDVSKGTLLSQLSSVRGENFGYETPASATARTISSLLRTDRFIQSVAETAGVTGALERGQLTALGLRGRIFAAPSGDTLLEIAAVTDNPTLSARLVQATIDSFIEYEVATDVSDSRAAESFFDTQVKVYMRAVDDAEEALTAYADAHPGGPLNERPLDEQIEIERLTSAVTEAQANLTAAEQKTEEARLATDQSTSDVKQRLRIIDEPQIATAPEPRLKQAVLTVAFFMCVGLLVTVGAVVLGSITDRSIRSAEDVEQLLALPLLAVVPEAKSARRRGRHARKQAAASTSSPAASSPPRLAQSGAGSRGPPDHHSPGRRRPRHAVVRAGTSTSPPRVRHLAPALRGPSGMVQRTVGAATCPPPRRMRTGAQFCDRPTGQEHRVRTVPTCRSSAVGVAGRERHGCHCGGAH